MSRVPLFCIETPKADVLVELDLAHAEFEARLKGERKRERNQQLDDQAGHELPEVYIDPSEPHSEVTHFFNDDIEEETELDFN